MYGQFSTVVKLENHTAAYTLSNFELRLDVMSLHIWGELPWNAHLAYEITAEQACFRVTCSEARNLLRVTSLLILKLDRVYASESYTDAKVTSVVYRHYRLPCLKKIVDSYALILNPPQKVWKLFSLTNFAFI